MVVYVGPSGVVLYRQSGLRAFRVMFHAILRWFGNVANPNPSTLNPQPSTLKPEP